MLRSSIFRFFTKPANLTLAKEHLIREVAKMEERRAASEVPEAAEEPRSKSPRPDEACSSSSLGSVFDEILQEQQAEARSVSKTAADVQMQTYLSLQTTPMRSNPLHFWKEHVQQFPSLAAVARKFLCAPCTSVDSERLFSVVSNILDEKRSRLTADRVEMMVFLKRNMHFMHKE